MRLPYIQVAQEAFTSAKVLGRLLKMSEHEALGRLCQLWAAALSWTPEGGAPEAMGVVQGENAAIIIAAAMDYLPPDEDMDGFARALMVAGVVEAHPQGLRLRGMDRYANALGAGARRSASAQKAARARWAKPKMPDACATDAPRMPDASAPHGPRNASAMRGDAQTQTQTQTQENNTSARERAPVGVSGGPSAFGPGELVDRLLGAWKAQRGADYAWDDHRDGMALRTLLAKPGGGEQEILRRWAIALEFDFPFCTGLSDLARHWNAYAAPKPPRGGTGGGAAGSGPKGDKARLGPRPVGVSHG